MTTLRLIVQTLKHYWKQNVMLALGIVVSTAVLTGALIIGDSVQYTLDDIVRQRLGQITQVVSASDRYFSAGLAKRLQNETGHPVAPLLLIEGMASSEGGRYQVPRIQVLGVDSSFSGVSGNGFATAKLGPGEALVSANLARRLNLGETREMTIRIKKLSQIPLNAPFVAGDEVYKTITVKVDSILQDDNMGRFDIRNTQSAPYNVFLSLPFLNQAMEVSDKANHLLISSGTHSEEIELALQRACTLEDLNLKITRSATADSGWEVTSDRVFIDRAIQVALEAPTGNTEPVLTYLVNNLSFAGRETPYSFVSTLGDTLEGTDEIIVTDWLADDLGVQPGDTITLDYYVIGPLRVLEERSHRFVVSAIVPIAGRWANKALMPRFPGLSDAGNCRDWDTGIPVDLEKIRTKDEAYWDTYRGIPKAYISYHTARRLWGNRYGESTMLTMTSDLAYPELEKWIVNKVDPLKLGFQVKDVRAQADRSSTGGVDFSQLFMGLSFFLLLSSVLLTALLFHLNTMTRLPQLGTLSVLGFTRRKIRYMLLGEGLLVSIIGALLGLLLAISYHLLVLKALNSIWYDIVRTQILKSNITLQALGIGFGVSVLISLLAIAVTLRTGSGRSAHQIQTRTSRPPSKRMKALKSAIILATGIAGIALAIWNYLQPSLRDATLFFVSGTLLLISCLLLVHQIFQGIKKPGKPVPLKTHYYIWKNITFHSRQAFLVVAMFSIATFLIVSTGAHRQDLFSSSNKKTSGTGGFEFYGETTMPVLEDLNDPQVRFLSGLNDDYPITQIRVHAGDDASCLNLNRTEAPGILGVNPDRLSGRFNVIRKSPELDAGLPWQSLRARLGENVLPAIADQSVIQWGLGKRVGDTLQYLDETGETMFLKLIGGLENSIFQGNVLIAGEHFLKHFPSSSGTNIFLVDGDPDRLEGIAEELRMGLRDVGLDLQYAPERLAMFNSIQNTYLSIFMLLGGLGLIIGTFGLAVVLARNLLDRRKETGIMSALGFTNTSILKMISLEHFYLLGIGVGIGVFCSVVATLPSWLHPDMGFSPGTVLLILGAVFLSGIFWIVLIVSRFLRGERVVGAMRND